MVVLNGTLDVLYYNLFEDGPPVSCYVRSDIIKISPDESCIISVTCDECFIKDVEGSFSCSYSVGEFEIKSVLDCVYHPGRYWACFGTDIGIVIFDLESKLCGLIQEFDQQQKVVGCSRLVFGFYPFFFASWNNTLKIYKSTKKSKLLNGITAQLIE